MPVADRFTDKVVFVTGAARGIGRAAAVAFAQENAKLAIADLKEGDLRETAEAVRAAGGDVVTIGCDISAPEQVEAAVAKVVETYGRLDCAFNNAGIENKPFAVHEIPVDEWDRIIGTNLRGTFLCMKYELAQMVEQGGGVIVNTSSGAGIRGVKDGATYSSAKHGMIGLTKSAALDYATKNIRVNAVVPGNIETSMMDRFTGGELQKAIDLEPVGRMGKPEEIAAAVLWLASDLGAFATGSAVVVDGGWSL